MANKAQYDWTIIVLTHSSCKALSMAGILVAETGLGFTNGEAKINKIISNLNSFTSTTLKIKHKQTGSLNAKHIFKMPNNNIQN